MRKITVILFIMLITISCNVMESDNISDSSGTGSSDSPSLSVQVNPFRSGGTTHDIFGSGGTYNDLSTLNYALILTDSKDVSTIQSRVSAGGSLVKKGAFSSTEPLYQELLSFNFTDIEAGDYYLVFMIDYNKDGTYFFDDSKIFISEMVFLGEILYFQDFGGGTTSEEVFLPPDANVSVTSEESQFLYFDTNIIIREDFY